MSAIRCLLHTGRCCRGGCGCFAGAGGDAGKLRAEIGTSQAPIEGAPSAFARHQEHETPAQRLAEVKTTMTDCLMATECWGTVYVDSEGEDGWAVAVQASAAGM